MNTGRILLIISAIIIGLSHSQKLFAQEIDQLIKTERYYNLYDVKERLDLESYTPKQLENYISSEFKYCIEKELTYDKTGRIIQEKVFRRAGVELMAVETTSNYSYSKDTITRKDYNEDGTLRIISIYLEKNNEHQIFRHAVFRVPEIMTPGVTSKPLRKETIYHYNLSEGEQQELLSNLSDTFPVKFIFINEIEEDGFFKTITTSSTGSWPPEVLRVQITDPETGKSFDYSCRNTCEETETKSFPTASDTLSHRIYKKFSVDFKPEQEKNLNFRPDQYSLGKTLRHEEWITLTPNDSMRITSHITWKGGKNTRKSELHYLHDLLVKRTAFKLEAGVWKKHFTKNYIRYKNFCLLENEKLNDIGQFKNYYLSVYEYY